MSMVRLLQFKYWVKSLALSLSLCADADTIQVQAQESSPTGCWEDAKAVADDPIARLCLRRDGSIGPILMEKGDSEDSGAWEKLGDTVLSLRLDSSTKEIVCKFSVSPGLRLTLTECSNPQYSREFAHFSNAEGVSAGRYLGCWMWQQRHGRYVSGLSLCFYEGGKLHGVDIDNIHGVDFGGTWSVPGDAQLQLHLGGSTQNCSAQTIEDPKALVLTACDDPRLSNTYKKLAD
jgi:hypothetical protein